jgi:hypothetical protein
MPSSLLYKSDAVTNQRVLLLEFSSAAGVSLIDGVSSRALSTPDLLNCGLVVGTSFEIQNFDLHFDPLSRPDSNFWVGGCDQKQYPWATK